MKSQYVVFKLGEEEYAISINSVKEVVPTPKMAKLPKTPDYIKGIVNIRGEVITLIDLEEKFNIKPEKKSYVLVVEDLHKIGVLLTDVPVTLTILNSDIDTASNIINQDNYLRGIIKLKERMIIIIDIKELLINEKI